MRTWAVEAICTECKDPYTRHTLRRPAEADRPREEGRCSGCVGQRNAEADRATRKAKERYEEQLQARQKKRRKPKPKPESPEGGPGKPGAEDPAPWWDH